MEIKKEDFVRFHIVNTIFYALPKKFFDDNATIEEIIKEEIKEVIEEVPTKEELKTIKEAEAKEAKKIKLMAELAALEE